MKILLCSYVFPPSVGGIETVSRILAEQFSRLGSTVTVVTHTPGEEFDGEYRLFRRPSLRKLRELARGSDIIFQSNISLKTLLPLILARQPIVIAHHGRIARIDGTRGWQDHLKRALLFRCSHVAISAMVAADLPVKSVTIADPFEPGEFADPEDGVRDKDIVFLGRLVSDKGCDLTLRALALLKQEGLHPSFTVIGDGPEMPALPGTKLWWCLQFGRSRLAWWLSRALRRAARWLRRRAGACLKLSAHAEFCFPTATLGRWLQHCGT